MRLGKCIDLSIVSPNIALAGGATGTWTVISATKATFAVTHPPGGACGGTDAGPYAALSLLCRGCGSVKVSVAGTGSHKFASTPNAGVYVLTPTGEFSAQGVLSLQGGSGGASCSSTALVASGGGATNKTWNVACGAGLYMDFGSGLNHDMPALHCTFTIEVLT